MNIGVIIGGKLRRGFFFQSNFWYGIRYSLYSQLTSLTWSSSKIQIAWMGYGNISSNVSSLSVELSGVKLNNFDRTINPLPYPTRGRQQHRMLTYSSLSYGWAGLINTCLEGELCTSLPPTYRCMQYSSVERRSMCIHVAWRNAINATWRTEDLDGCTSCRCELAIGQR